jgi:putative transposase
VVSGIIDVIRNGVSWRDIAAVYGPHKTLYNPFVRGSGIASFERRFANLAAETAHPIA